MRLALIVTSVFVLSGCMEALQGSPAADVTPFAPPAPRPTQTAAATEELVPSTGAGQPEGEPAGTEAALPSQTVMPAEPTQDAALPTATPAATGATPGSAAPVPTLTLPTPAGQSNEERWRAQQDQREVFPALLPFTTVRSELWWYDPINQQSVVLGSFNGDFSAQARFIVRSNGQEALEVPYQVNTSYGLTALSPAVIDRIRAAGYSDWVETFVYLTPEVQPR